jgi:allantoin racemase
MKLWYQSLTRPTAWPAYNAALRAVLDAAKDAGTTIEVHGVEKRGGVGDQYRYLEFVEAQEVLENVERASREGFDAFLIGNFADPGLREAREIADFPVLGLCETSVHLASIMAGSFSLVTGNQKAAPKILENITRYGLREKLFCVRRMSVDRLLDLNEAFAKPATGKALVDEFLAAASANVDEGAELVIPAVGVVMTLLAHRGVNEVSPGIPILNGVTALVKMGEAAVKMRKLFGGSWTSRRAMYAAPPPDQIEEIRSYYGPVYPWVKKPNT